MNREVYRNPEGIVSKNITEIDNTNKNGGKLKFTRILEMDEAEAVSQFEWVLNSLKKAKGDLENLKNSITREGLANYQNEQRKKIKNIKEQVEEFEDLKDKYEKCNIKRRTNDSDKV